jgi:uncharacterized protein (TIGR04552 family)
VVVDDPARAWHNIDQFSLYDLEALRIVLSGGSVIDWHRLNFRSEEDVREFLRVQEFREDERSDHARLEAIKREAIDYLRRNFEFPVPRSVEDAPALDLFTLASGKGHKQVCACIILKVMHIIHHLQGRELLTFLPLSDAEVFHLVEEKVYRVVGGMMAAGLPITEFLGGRKNRDSLYTKLLSKRETIAAQIYDKLRFRIVSRTPDDLFPVVNYLARRLFPFNYAIPGESTNTLVDFQAVCRTHPHLAALLPQAQGAGPDDAAAAVPDNKFSARSYRVIHFVVDMPVRVPARVLDAAPPNARSLGPVIFVLTEFQIVDQETDAMNEMGEASHARYKERQQRAVMERLRMGFRGRPRPIVDHSPMELLAPAPEAGSTNESEPPARSPSRTSKPPRR